MRAGGAGTEIRASWAARRNIASRDFPEVNVRRDAPDFVRLPLRLGPLDEAVGVRGDDGTRHELGHVLLHQGRRGGARAAAGSRVCSLRAGARLPRHCSVKPRFGSSAKRACVRGDCRPKLLRGCYPRYVDSLASARASVTGVYRGRARARALCLAVAVGGRSRFSSAASAQTTTRSRLTREICPAKERERSAPPLTSRRTRFAPQLLLDLVNRGFRRCRGKTKGKLPSFGYMTVAGPPRSNRLGKYEFFVQTAAPQPSLYELKAGRSVSTDLLFGKPARGDDRTHTLNTRLTY